jgi:hypothetical protein
MITIRMLQSTWNEIITSAISNEYNKFEKQTDIVPLVNKLNEMLLEYAKEVKEEKETESEVQRKI